MNNFLHLFQSFIKLFAIALVALHANNIYSQDFIENEASLSRGDSSDIFTETIRIISRSKKTFIMTNSNQLLNKGDFITLALNPDAPKAVARSVVAKNHNDLVGIKILKIYSLKRWEKLRNGKEVLIIKGDDAFLFKPKKEAKVVEEEKIESEEDLFNEKGIDEDLDSFYKDKRHIKPDNLITVGWSQYKFQDPVVEQGEVTLNQWNFTYAFQFADNYWIEGLYGRSRAVDFPNKGLKTTINNYTIRVKYTFKAPLYSYILPYIGIQTYQASSSDEGESTDTTVAAQEAVALADIRKTNIAVGLTLLRRLVPGWFLRADLGNDIQAIGVGIEF